ncbi:MAG: DNA repair protein RadC [Cyanobacteria bacterium J06650_10]
MKVKDTEGRYGFALRTEGFIGDIVSPAVARRIMCHLFLPDEQPSDYNVQQRLREALNSGSLQVKGLGPSGLKRLQSAVSLGKALYNSAPAAGTTISDPSVAAAIFHPIACESVEKFAAIAVDVTHRALSTRVISTGTATETCAHPRDIFRWVMQVGGTRCVVGHNHPSGSVEPSEEDILLTKQLIEGGKLLGIPVLDHLVVSGSEYNSLRQTTCLWAKASA